MLKIVDVPSGAGVGSVGFWTEKWRDTQVYEVGWVGNAPSNAIYRKGSGSSCSRLTSSSTPRGTSWPAMTAARTCARLRDDGCSGLENLAPPTR